MTADELFSMIPLAVRLHLDATSYSNALPGWIDPVVLDYQTVEEAVARRLEGYLAGDRPARPFEILVPTKPQGSRTWLLPAVYDQILLQVSAACLAGHFAGAALPDPSRVFSYRLNDDPDRLFLTRSQIRCWIDFQNETRRRLEDSSHLLQIDLEKAFPSIDRDGFLAFLKKQSPENRAVDLLSALLDRSVVPAPGIPMINDSLSYLGNAFLHTVDLVLHKNGADFIRFVDDYRVFGTSSQALEKTLERVSRDLKPLGFRINLRKLRLGMGEEYLEAVAKLRHARTTEDADGYVSAAIFEDLVRPEQMAELVERALARPEEILTEGFGRFLLGAQRRQRVNEVVAAKRTAASPRQELLELLNKERFAVRALEILRQYAFEEATAWKAVSVLYLMEDLPQDSLREPLREMLASRGLPEIVELSIRRLLAGPDKPLPKETEVFGLGHLEAGRVCYRGEG